MPLFRIDWDGQGVDTEIVEEDNRFDVLIYILEEWAEERNRDLRGVASFIASHGGPVIPEGDINDQTPELCLAAVSADIWALQFVKDQTVEICLAAIKNDRKNMNYVLKFIKPELRQDVFITFVKDNPEILKDVLTSDQIDNIFARA